ATPTTTRAMTIDGRGRHEFCCRGKRMLTMDPSQPAAVLPGCMPLRICRRYVPARTIKDMRVLIVEDEPYLADAIRDGLRLEAIAADIAGDGEAALDLLSSNTYDIAILDRDVPRLSGDEIARRIVASASGLPILMLTAADRLDDK